MSPTSVTLTEVLPLVRQSLLSMTSRTTLTAERGLAYEGSFVNSRSNFRTSGSTSVRVTTIDSRSQEPRKQLRQRVRNGSITAMKFAREV